MYEEAVQHPNKDKWLNTMWAELQTMKDMGVYRFVKLSEGCKMIGCYWVLEFKDGNKGGSMSYP